MLTDGSARISGNKTLKEHIKYRNMALQLKDGFWKYNKNTNINLKTFYIEMCLNGGKSGWVHQFNDFLFGNREEEGGGFIK